MFVQFDSIQSKLCDDLQHWLEVALTLLKLLTCHFGCEVVPLDFARPQKPDAPPEQHVCRLPITVSWSHALHPCFKFPRWADELLR